MKTKEVIELKHKNSKEILNIKEKMENNKHSRKVDYLQKLYNEKHKFLKAEEQAKEERLLKLYALRNDEKLAKAGLKRIANKSKKK